MDNIDTPRFARGKHDITSNGTAVPRRHPVVGGLTAAALVMGVLGVAAAGPALADGALAAGSNSCAAPTVVGGSGTSTGSTSTNSDKHDSNWAYAVQGGGSPDAVWEFSIAQPTTVDIAETGTAHWVQSITLAYAPDTTGGNACGSASADKAEADNLTQSIQSGSYTFDLKKSDLSAGTYLVWLDGDTRYPPNSGAYQLQFSFSSPPVSGASPPSDSPPTTTPAPSPAPTTTVQPDTNRRLGDSTDATDAAVQLSQGEWADGSATSVVLARDDVFADSLAGDALAGKSGPVLYTTGGSSAGLRPETLAEIKRVLGAPQACGAPQVLIVGGTSAVSSTAESTLGGLGYCVVRVSGTDRVATSIAIASYLLQHGDTAQQILLSRDDDWADAAAGGAYSAATGAPILVTASTSLDPRVARLLASAHPGQIVLLGGVAALASTVQSSAASFAPVMRVSGAARDSTATAIAQQLWGPLHPSGAILVPGFAPNGWAYALAGAVDGASEGAVELYAQSSGLTSADSQYLTSTPVNFAITDGPASLLTDQVSQQAQADESSSGGSGGSSGSGGSGDSGGGSGATLPSSPAGVSGPSPCPTNIVQHFGVDLSVPQGIQGIDAGVTADPKAGCRLSVKIQMADMSQVAAGLILLDTDGNGSDGCNGADLAGFFNSAVIDLLHTPSCDTSTWTAASDIDAFGAVSGPSIDLEVARSAAPTGTRMQVKVAYTDGSVQSMPSLYTDVVD